LEFGKPDESFFEIGEGAHGPSLESADEGEFADAAMRVLPVKDGQALVATETGLVEAFDESGEFIAGEERFVRDRQATEVEDGSVDAAFAAGAGDRMEGFAAGVEVKVGMRVEADEVRSADDLQFQRHVS